MEVMGLFSCALSRRVTTDLALASRALRFWTPRHVLVSLGAGAAVLALVGFATVLIPNSVFSRDIPPVWWNYPIWILTSTLSGMLVATFVRPPASGADTGTGSDAAGRLKDEDAHGSRLGMAGGILAWFAVGCPVCNKLALLALGYSGAITWFAPVQPFLALGALTVTTIALVGRLRGQISCPASLPQETGRETQEAIR